MPGLVRHQRASNAGGGPPHTALGEQRAGDSSAKLRWASTSVSGKREGPGRGRMGGQVVQHHQCIESSLCRRTHPPQAAPASRGRAAVGAAGPLALVGGVPGVVRDAVVDVQVGKAAAGPAAWRARGGRAGLALRRPRRRMQRSPDTAAAGLGGLVWLPAHRDAASSANRTWR